MASYLALARKYRPSEFSEIVGQKHIVTTLVNALDTQNLHHAFLFTGTRGVGKTSIARIFAKALNCEQKISSKPCGKCHSCVEIAKGSSLDLIEFDAASRTGVDDMRDILENAQYMPSNSRFKIYLIDEVHMLSTSSFNALLKTLEEPPAHIKFLFATTDAQKLPITILSRCLLLNLQKITDSDIEQQLASIVSDEKYPFEPNALKHIAQCGEGSMRDALSLLDQAIAYTNQNITEQKVIEMLGIVSHTNVMEMIEHLVNQDANALLKSTQEMAAKGENFEQLLKSLMRMLHQMNFIKVGISNTDAKLTKLAEQLSEEQLQLLYQIALHGLKDLKFSPTHQVGFEIILLRMITFALNNADERDDRAEGAKKKTAR